MSESAAKSGLYFIIHQKLTHFPQSFLIIQECTTVYKTACITVKTVVQNGALFNHPVHITLASRLQVFAH